MNYAKPWSGEQIATFHKLRKEGASSETIAREVGRSRSAVCGFAMRHGLKIGRQVIGGNSKAARAQWSKSPKLVVQLSADEKAHRLAMRAEKLTRIGEAFKPLPESRPVSLVEARGYQCRWPIDGDEFRFCGACKEDQSSYCAGHNAMASSSRSARAGVASEGRLGPGGPPAIHHEARP